MFYQCLLIFNHKMDCLFKSSMCDERAEGEKRIMLCPPRSRGSSCSCVYLDQWESEDKTFSWIKLLPSGICKVVRMCFHRQFEESKVIQQLNKSFFCRRNMSHLLILHQLQKMKRPLVLWGRKSSGDDVIHDLPWWIINCFFTAPVCSLTVWCTQNWKELVKIPSSRFNGTHL